MKNIKSAVTTFPWLYIKHCIQKVVGKEDLFKIRKCTNNNSVDLQAMGFSSEANLL